MVNHTHGSSAWYWQVDYGPRVLITTHLSLLSDRKIYYTTIHHTTGPFPRFRKLRCFRILIP